MHWGSNAEHAAFRILERPVFREVGRAECNRFRETGTETTSGIKHISRESFKRSYFFPAAGLRCNVSRTCLVRRKQNRRLQIIS